MLLRAEVRLAKNGQYWMISYWHRNVVCPPVCPPLMLCIVTIRVGVVG